ncbi:hypothetical protein ES703_115956 [subsurface metagenome]
MRAYQLLVIALCAVIMAIGANLAWICFKVATEGSLTLIEPVVAIIVSELMLALLIMLGAAFVLFCEYRRRNDD